MAGATFKKPNYNSTVTANAEVKATGKTNIPVETLIYIGKTTDTAKVNIDNDEKTIAVEVLGSGKDGNGNEITDTYVNDIKLAQEDEELVLTATAKSGAVLSKERLAFDLARAKGLYYDIDREIDPDTALWYLTTEIDEHGYGTKESIIKGSAGYNLGAGGGGGGGSGTNGGTEVMVAVMNPETGESMWPSTVALNTDVNIGVYWTSKKRGSATGPGNLSVFVNDKKVISRSCNQGIVYFDITKYLVAGDNTVKVTATDMYGTVESVVGMISAVALNIESNFDYGLPYTGKVTYRYTPYGSVEKDVVFIIDAGTATETESHQKVKSTGEQQTFIIRNLTHGSHTLTVYMKAVIDGVEVLSNELFYDIIYYKAGEKTPIIASEYRNTTQYQYTSFQIPYRVYTPGKDTSQVELYVNEEKYGETLSVGQGKKYWTYRSNETGPHSLEIRVGEVSRVFDINIEKLVIPVESVTDSLALALNAVGRNNDEPLETRSTWEDKAHGISCIMSGFNWASNGWMQDDDGVDILRVAGSARVEIPYKPFGRNFTDTGKTFEFEIATRDIKAYDSVIISSLLGGSTVSKVTWLTGEDDRILRFEVSDVDEAKFIAKINEAYDQYVFVYSEELGWQINTNGVLSPVTLDEITDDYGITLKYIDRSGASITEPYEQYFMDGDRFAITYEIVGRGIYLTPQLAKLQAQQSSLSAQYKEDDHVRLTFVIESKDENRLMYMYINGIMSGVAVYPTSENFAQAPAQPITIGSNDATIDIYNLRIYDAALSRKQVVNNWIADTNDMALKKERYDKNNNYDDYGNLVISKLPPETPYMILTAPELPNYKKDRKAVEVKFVYPLDDSRSFTAPKARADVQGTSSQYYYRKNFKIKFENGFYIGGSEDLSEHYHITPEAKKEKTFTFKADVASSEGTNNVELVRYFEDTKNFDVPPEKLQDPEDTAEGYKTSDRIRVGIDGFPIVMFHDAGNGEKFYGKMNFNNDKANDRTFGFKDGDECWEFTNNSNKLVQFQEADMSIWQDSFESRYPEEYGDDEHIYGTKEGELDKLTEVVNWIVSTRRLDTDTEEQKAAKLKRFRDDLTIYFDQTSALFYYLFTELFLMVDSRAKNAMMCYYKSRTPGDGGNKWFWIPYDMDTALGINNEGLLTFDYDAEDTDLVHGANVYNGQASTFWNNIRDAFPTELREMYTKLRSEKWSFASIEKYFEDHQKVWSEVIFNEDAYTKYLEPLLLENNASYLGMAQGSKEQQRRWWMANRFKYLDSKYRAGDAVGQNVMFRVYGRGELNITPYINCFVTAIFDQANNYVSVDAEKNKPAELIPPTTWDPNGNDAVLALYSADMIKDFGDLSGFKPGYADFSAASKLQKLKVGDPSIENEKMTGLMVGNNHLLTEIDARNCKNLGYGEGSEVTKTIDLSGCVSIEKVLFDNTQILGVQFPVGGYLKEVSLPATITMLELRDHPGLEKLTLAGTDNLKSIWLENIPSAVIDAFSLIKSLPDESPVRLIGIDNTFETAAQIRDFYDTLDRMHGKTFTGADCDIHLSVTGTINIHEISYADYIDLSARFDQININADIIWCTVNFFTVDKDGNDLLVETQTIKSGDRAATPEIPTKPSTQVYYYTFNKWDTDFECIESNLDIRAIFDEHIQRYTATFDTQSTLITVQPASETLYYGETLSTYEVDGTTRVNFGALPENVYFLGWYVSSPSLYYEIGEPWGGWRPGDEDKSDTDTTRIWEFGNKKLVDNVTLSARWLDDSAPTLDLYRVKHNTFGYTCIDNVAVVAYKVSETPEITAEDTDWIAITAQASLNGTYELDHAGTFYFSVKDAQGNLITKSIVAKQINKTQTVGVDSFNIYEGDEVVGDFALEGTRLTTAIQIDSHYENEEVFVNGIRVFEEAEILVDKDLNFNATCNPKFYNVTFVLLGKGNQSLAETQSVEYLHTAVQPDPQADEGFVIQHWCTTEEAARGQSWLDTTDKYIFDENPITEDITLYAKWIESHEPTTIRIHLDEPTRVYLNFIQAETGGVKYQWEVDDDINAWIPSGSKRTSSKEPAYGSEWGYGPFYDFEAGDHTIRLASVSGTYGLGWGDQAHPVITPISALTSIEFPPDIPYLSEYGLSNATGLTEITLTEYMTKISAHTFAGCTNLKIVNLSDSIFSIEREAFLDCPSLETIIIPRKITALTAGTFKNCTGLKSIELPAALTKLAEEVFANCASLETINLPNGLTEISESLFLGCESLKAIDIPESVETIGGKAFAACSQLESVIIRSKTVTMSGSYAFNSCPKLNTVGPIGGDYNIQYAWTDEIPDLAFSCGFGQSSINSVVLVDTIKRIGGSAFYACKLNYIDLPTKLNYIGSGAFERCNLLEVSIPFSTRGIGSAAFRYCTSLKIVNIHTTGIEESYKTYRLNQAWFYATSGSLTIHIPASLAGADDDETLMIAKNAYGENFNGYLDSIFVKVIADLTD